MLGSIDPKSQIKLRMPPENIFDVASATGTEALFTECECEARSYLHHPVNL